MSDEVSGTILKTDEVADCSIHVTKRVYKDGTAVIVLEAPGVKLHQAVRKVAEEERADEERKCAGILLEALAREYRNRMTGVQVFTDIPF